jgi:type VI secretion system protein VasD
MMLKVSSAIFLASALLLSGCGAWQAVSDTSVDAYDAVFHSRVKVLNVDFDARSEVNPDDAGRSTSVAVRVYQLKDRKLFDGASYAGLVANDKALLAQDLQAITATVVNPGASASLSDPMKKGTEYIGIAAFFRHPGKDSVWKQVIASKKLSADAPLRLVIAKQSLTFADEDARPRKK